jgi:alkaline phosphatase D
MSALRPPGLGPLIGHTTEKSCRLWIQAPDPEGGPGGPGADRRSVGVLGLLSADRRQVKEKYYFRLHREFDRTGTFVLGQDVTLGRHEMDGVPKSEQDQPAKLKPDTEYAVRMATLAVDDPMPDAESIPDRELARRLPPIENMAPLLLDLPPELCEVTFRTFPAQKLDSMAFLLGSCRYPGLLWKIKEADRIFAPMAKHFSGKHAARFTLMVGDQIYADQLNRLIPVGRADTYEDFQERYRTAFSSPNMRRLLRTAPSYMILDDHEIEDNWSQDRLRDNGKRQLFNWAIGAYMSYQWSHGPRTFGRLLYYHFDCGGYPFFVIDTRTQRFKDDIDGNLADNHLLGRPTIDPAHPGQLRRLLDWLSAQQEERGNVPKFIASSSVFAPNAVDERLFEPGEVDDVLYQANRKRRDRSDSWPAYPNTRKAILDHIVTRKIQNVILLSGDIHCSNIAQLEFAPNGAELRAYDVTSSAFYWPFPFADGDPNNYVHDSRQQIDPFPIPGGEMNYRSWAFTQEDNFCRLEVDRSKHCLRVSYYDRDGNILRVTNDRGHPVTVNSLDLAEWN